MNWMIAFFYMGTTWIIQLCVLWEYHFLVGKKAEYLLYMTIRGEKREDEDVVQLVQAFKKEFWRGMAVLLVTAGGFFLLALLPVGVASIMLFYMTGWTTALFFVIYKVVKKYANRMYELKISKGWGRVPKESVLTVDTVVSRMKKTMPVSEIWLVIPAWICIGSFVWWLYCAVEYKILLVLLITNVLAFLFFCYMYYRLSHGKLKVYCEDSDVNFALNRAAKRAWSGCVVLESFLVSGYHFIAVLFLHTYMKNIAIGAEDVTGLLWGLILVTCVFTILMIGMFIGAAGRVRRAKQELAIAADCSYAEDEDAYWRNGYYYNPYDTSTFVENRGYGLTTNMATKWGPITKWILIGVIILCIGLGIALLPIDFGTMTMKIREDRVELRGCLYYNETLDFDDVSEVHLLEELPDRSRAWGTGTDRFSMGSYHFKGYGNGKAMIDHEAEYFLLVKRKNEKWFGFSVTDSEEMLKLYERLKVENP